MLHKTEHAKLRQQQRGITDQHVDLVLKYGLTFRQKDEKKGSAWILCFSKKMKKKIEKENNKLKNLWKVYLLVEGGCIKTVAYRHKKIKGLVHQKKMIWV